MSQPPPNPYYQQVPPNPYYQGKLPGRPSGMTIISVYEIIYGAFIILVGLLFLYSANSAIQLNGSLYDTNYQSGSFIIGIILLSWGACGVVGATLFLQWKQNGLVLSYIFLISTGIFTNPLYFIPSLLQ